MRLKELREKRVRLIAEARGILDKASAEKRETTAEENEQYDRIMADVDKLGKDIERAEKLESAEAGVVADNARRSGTIAAHRQHRNLGEMRGSDAYREAFRRYVRDGNPQHLRAADSGFSQLSDAEGGYLVPTSMSDSIYEALPEVNVMRQVATVLQSDSDRTFPVAGTVSATWIAEEGAYQIPTHNIFSVKTFSAFKAGLIIPVSDELLEDSAFDVEAMVARMFVNAIGALEEAAFVTGGGTTEPTGIDAGAGAGVTAASATAVTADELIDLFHSVAPQYRNQPRCGWLMEDATVKAIRKLKGGDGQYLWQPGLAIGQPDSLLGKRVWVSSHMDSIATTKVPIVFGDLSKYYIVDRSGIGLKRLDERYAEYGQVGFRMSKRTDGQLIDAAAVKKLTMA